MLNHVVGREAGDNNHTHVGQFSVMVKPVQRVTVRLG